MGHPQKLKAKILNFLKSELDFPLLWRAWTAL